MKRSEDKVVFFIKRAKESYEKGMRGALSKKEVGEHNQLIKLCQQARWEFMVHRQAVGFTIQNYQLVTSLYVIPPMLEE